MKIEIGHRVDSALLKRAEHTKRRETPTLDFDELGSTDFGEFSRADLAQVSRVAARVNVGSGRTLTRSESEGSGR
jgi:hypothetical protein